MKVVSGGMQINGHQLYVMSRGQVSGQPIVLLHHGLGSTRAWRKQVSALAAAGYYTINYDRWGYGKSDPRPALCLPGFEDDQADLLELLDRLEIERAALVGHSDGGTIALYFAAAHPERVTCLVTIAAHIYIEPKMKPGLVEVRKTFETDLEFREKFQRLHGDKYQQVFDNWYDGWMKPDHLSWDIRPTLAQIYCSTLVIQGLEDEHATPRHAEDIAAAIPGAQLWLVSGAGHMLLSDQAKMFNERLVAFLSQEERYVQKSAHRQPG